MIDQFFASNERRKYKKRKYTVVVTDNEEGNAISMKRENQGFTAIELLGLLDYIRMDIQKQITDKEFAEKNIEHKRAVVDEEEER